MAKSLQKRANITRKNLHHSKSPIHLNPNRPRQGGQEKRMIFGLNTPTTSGTQQVIILMTTPLVAKLALVRIQESKVCHEKTTTFEGAQSVAVLGEG
jgi:hypothetical protein